jgi:tetratricopeptide (TPR) repeat protein
MDGKQATNLDRSQVEELVQDFLEHMSAPPQEDASAFLPWRPPRGRLGWGSLLGLCLGAAAYLGWSAVQAPASFAAPLPALPAVSLPSAADAAPAAPVATEPATGRVRTDPALVQAPGQAEVTLPGEAAPELVAVRHPGRRRLSAAPEPGMSRAYKGLLRQGWTAYGRADWKKASVLFGRAVHLDQRQTAGYYGLALALFEQGAEDAALQVLARGAARVGPKTDLWLLAGSIYQWKGREKAARAAYQRYLVANPRGPHARDVRVILAYPHLPALLPFDGDGTLEQLAASE